MQVVASPFEGTLSSNIQKSKVEVLQDKLHMGFFGNKDRFHYSSELRKIIYRERREAVLRAWAMTGAVMGVAGIIFWWKFF